MKKGVLLGVLLIFLIGIVSSLETGVSGKIGIDLIKEIVDWTIANLHVRGNSIFEGTVIFKDNVTIITPASLVVNTSLTISDELGNPDIVLNSTGDSWFNGDGNVGIGTASPDQTLHLKSTGNSWLKIDAPVASHSVISFAGAGTDEIFLFRDADSDDLQIDSSTVFGLMTWKNDGKVGIGTITPTHKLNVVGDLNVGDDLFVNETTGYVGIGTASPFSTWVASPHGALQLYGLEPTIGFESAVGGDRWSIINLEGELLFYDDTDNHVSITFDGDGKVGIGTTSPTEVLTVKGNVSLNDTMYINAGKVGIGTTAPTHKLNVVGNVNVTGTIFTSALNISNSSFSFVDDENASIKYSVQNKNSGTNATSLITAINDVGNIMGIGIGSSNYLLGSLLMPNVTGLYSRSKGDSVFLNFYNQAFIWMFNPSDDNDANNLVEIMRLNETGLSVTGNITAKNVFVPQHIFVHNNETMVLTTASVWANVTFYQEEAEIKRGISHTFNDDTNHTFTINTDGIYEIYFDYDAIDTSASSTDIDVAGRVIYSNGTEIVGSVFETDITKKDIETEVSHDFFAKFFAGDVIVFQFVADDVDVQISTHGTFGDHPESATITIKKIANL